MKNTTKMLEDDPYLDSYLDAPWAKVPKAYQNIVHEDENVIVYKDGKDVRLTLVFFIGGIAAGKYPLERIREKNCDEFIEYQCTLK